MLAKHTFQVAGVDGCKAGWAAAIVKATKNRQYLQRLFVMGNFAAVLSATADCKFVYVDIPIGLSENSEPRKCDVAARQVLGKFLASSIFPAPVRQCFSTDDYKTACKISSKYADKRLSQQSFNIMDKIRQVDDLMTPEMQRRVREVHPEISFWALNRCRAICKSKKTPEGQTKRHKLLKNIFAGLDKLLRSADTKGYGIDDVYDALVAAYTAAQAVLKKVKTLPANPETDAKGLRMEIVYSTGV